jgi:hypothetical protein
MSEGGYELVLYAHRSNERGWEACIESWGWPLDREGLTPRPLTLRFNAGIGPENRVHGPTSEAALDALENELRALIRANPGTR